MSRKYGGFFKDSMTLIGSTSAAKVIGLALVPVVSRLYEPDEFGVVVIMLSLGMIFGTVSALRYDQAVLLPKSDEEAVVVARVAMLSVIAVSAVLLLAAALAAAYGEGLALVKKMGAWVYLVPVLVLMMGVSNIISIWCSRHRQFKTIGLSEVSVSIASGGGRIAFGAVYGSTVSGLIAGAILGYVSKLVVMRSALRTIMAGPRTSWLGMEAARSAIQHKDFPKYSVPTGLLNSIFQKLPVIMLGTMFVPAVVGLYAMASRISRLPIDVVSMPVRRIYMQRIARFRNEGQPMRHVLVKTTLVLFALGLAPFALIMVYGEWIFSVLLGEKWSEAGGYAGVLSPWLYSLFAISPASSNFVVLERQKLWFHLQIIAGVAGLASFAVAASLGVGPRETLAMFSAVGTVMNALVFIIVYVITSRADSTEAGMVSKRAGASGRSG